MPQLVDSLADLTALRDRDALDIALVSAINDMLQPQSTAICRVVGDTGNERWRICAQLNAGQTTSTSDSAWSTLDLLPPMSQHPLRQQVVAIRQVLQSSDCPSITVFPLASNPGAIGVLEIGTEAPLSEDAQRLVSGILRLYLNFQSLLDYGERDALTELLNRKTFDGAFLKATIEQQLAVDNVQGDRRDVACAGSYWLAMIDIDHFKRVNDNYGHLIGDEVLLLLARLMRAHFRFHDQLYRFGGEEFVVLMRCHGEAEAASVLERLRATTATHLFPQVGTITISIGFSEIKTGDTPSGAFERADKAVYHAKEHGRNQVCSHAALIASGELVAQAANIGDMELF
jgi:diguanylate cyclase (GGDEF)-like protein